MDSALGLIAHSIKHTGINPFFCTLCPRAWLDRIENDVATTRHRMKEDHQDKQSDADTWLVIHVRLELLVPA